MQERVREHITDNYLQVRIFYLNCKNAKLAVMLTTQEADFASEIEQHES
jgi:hypothetical protein